MSEYSRRGQIHLNRGIGKTERQDYAGAISDFNQAIKSDPDKGEAYHCRAVCKLGLRDADGAIADSDQAITLGLDGPEIYQLRAAAKLVLEDYDGVISDCNQAIALGLDEPEPYQLRATAKAELTDYAGAIADYDQAIKRDPDDTSLYSEREIAKAKLEVAAPVLPAVEIETAPDESAILTESEPPDTEPEIIELDYPPEPDNPLAPNIRPEPESPTPPEPETPPKPETRPRQSIPAAKKSKVVAALLAFLLGGFGAHKFYLGYPGAGIVHLVLSLTIIGALLNVPICVVEFLIYLSKSEEDFHQTYVVNRKRFF